MNEVKSFKAIEKFCCKCYERLRFVKFYEFKAITRTDTFKA